MRGKLYNLLGIPLTPEKETEMNRKNNPKDRPARDAGSARDNNAQKAEVSCIISPGQKCQPHRKIDLMSKRNYTIKKAPGAHLDYSHRLTLQIAWNGYVDGNYRTSIRQFAALHGLATETWRREYHRGATGETVVYRGRVQYARYSADKAQRDVDDGKRNMGAPMKLKAATANRLRQLIVDGRRSPYDARLTLLGESPGCEVPSLRTIYNHIDLGDMGVERGQTPYHPGRRRRPPGKAHPARVLPNRPRISERPPEAAEHAEPGHVEFDTVVSCAGGSGGLLTVVDAHTRRAALEKLDAIARADVLAALRRAVERDAVGTALKTATTDNGTEVSAYEEITAILGCPVYYTRAYASYEKGAVENLNRIVRRWFPKGTDFSKVPEEEVRAVEEIINSIHRKSLGGLSANAYHGKLKNAA